MSDTWSPMLSSSRRAAHKCPPSSLTTRALALLTGRPQNSGAEPSKALSKWARAVVLPIFHGAAGGGRVLVAREPAQRQSWSRPWPARALRRVGDQGAAV